jgi:acyl-CoA thioester hydrolase
MHQFAKFGMLLPGDATSNRENALHVGIEQTFARNPLPDHAGGPKQKDVHLFTVFQSSKAEEAMMRTKGTVLPQETETLERHQTRLRVRYAETDQMGVVYHANYLVWMEIGRVELVRSRGIHYKDLEQTDGVFLAVVAVNCRYLSPARYDQEIVIYTEIINSNARTVEFAYHIHSAEDHKLLAQGGTRHIWVNREMRPARLPEKYWTFLRVG